MAEGRIVRIYMSYVEPEDKGLLWMRPYLHREGYELLYFGAKGWTKWLPCCDSQKHIEDIPEYPDSDNELEYPGDIDTPCECL